MLQETRGIVLRSVKYGETSLISTIFTEQCGVQSYIIQGVRTARSKGNKAALLQPATLLELVAYHKPHKNLHHLKEFQPAYLYHSVHEDVVRNSIALFSVEVLLRLLPEQAAHPELFRECFDYLCKLDQMSPDKIANFPLYYVISCGRLLGYELRGSYSTHTPHLNLLEGGYSAECSPGDAFIPDEDAALLTELLKIDELEALNQIEMNAARRSRLLHWYLDFLHQHTQHLGQVKSLAVLQAIFR